MLYKANYLVNTLLVNRMSLDSQKDINIFFSTVQLRTRRAIILYKTNYVVNALLVLNKLSVESQKGINVVQLRIRRVLLLYKANGISTLLVLKKMLVENQKGVNDV